MPEPNNVYALSRLNLQYAKQPKNLRDNAYTRRQNAQKPKFQIKSNINKFEYVKNILYLVV